MSREWLLANRLGSYSSSTTAGCNTRRYHALLTAATNPPVGRIVALSMLMEQVYTSQGKFELACNEFPNGVFAPQGWRDLRTFTKGIIAEYDYRIGDRQTLKKRVLLCRDSNTLIVRYELSGEAEKIIIRPFTPMRDFHHLANAGYHPDFEVSNGRLAVTAGEQPKLVISCDRAEFLPDMQWWFNFYYRTDAARGQDFMEDLPSAGYFTWRPSKKKESCEIVASLDGNVAVKFLDEYNKLLEESEEIDAGVSGCPDMMRCLAQSGNVFLVDRKTPDDFDGASILAGFPWFADWGRDTFIALPGLLLSTGRFELARRVFKTYADNISQGMIPNRFDDYGLAPHYNSIDASLWFTLAALRYIRADDSHEGRCFEREVLLPACKTIVDQYRAGTMFGIHEDTDGLLVGGDENTQLTWMDVRIDNESVTPRYGKAVELNALWYQANALLGDIDAKYAVAARKTAGAFINNFWLENAGYLADCVYPYGPDKSLRPNQILAAALPYSPLKPAQIKSIVKVVREKLLTPLGLRTLSPDDWRYKGRYEGPQYIRDRAYHQGTAWAWLMGFYIEASIKTGASRAQLARLMKPFEKHMAEGCLGQINEIFDGDAPHTPRGCFAQAWSVAEVLRATEMIARLSLKKG
ncbi:MAG TPA: amylo-alpha-1,6-glucosidase [Phycisphaerae bacterium]|nr:amylo-alpha-1,6-glucosidase [Phycisphaerae bacterium]HPS52181.1 amylo-alpha-1,6-glucosidase [Phycisphaerae bacterium]